MKTETRYEKLMAALAEARNEQERQALLAHATEQGPCDAERCPWNGFRESLCIRTQTHGPNCRCSDCCATDESFD